MSTRLKAALAFGLAGAAAAAAHVLFETPGALRDWRQTLPLAAFVGALLGAAGKPASWRAGLWLGLAALASFAVLFALGHGVIEAVRGGEATREALNALERTAGILIGPTGVAALAMAAVAGLAVGRSRTRREREI